MFKSVVEAFATFANEPEAREVCLNMQKLTGRRFYREGVNVFQVRPHPMSTTRAMQRLWPTARA